MIKINLEELNTTKYWLEVDKKSAEDKLRDILKKPENERYSDENDSIFLLEEYIKKIKTQIRNLEKSIAEHPITRQS